MYYLTNILTKLMFIVNKEFSLIFHSLGYTDIISTMEVIKLSETKLSVRLFKQLLFELREGKFANSEILPKEEVLAQHLKISRTALRDVLKTLEQEGYILRVKKKGTIINKRVLDLNFRIDIDYEFKDLLELAGLSHTSKVISYEEITADPYIAKQLELKEGQPLIKLEKVIYSNRKPVIYCIDYLNLEQFPTKPEADHFKEMDIFSLLESLSGEVMDFNITKLIPALPDKSTAKLFKSTGPLLSIEEVGFTRNLKAILFARIFWNSDFFDFHLVRKRYLG